MIDEADDRTAAQSAEPGPTDTVDVPNDNTTMTDVLRRYEEAGWRAQFFVDDDEGTVRCVQCGTTSAPERIDVHSVRRLEGASDPADMAGVLAVSCRHCEARGTMVLAYGPHASEGEARLWRHFADQRGDDQAPRGMAPGEDRERPTPTR